jgi:hypothetical protein
VCVEACGAADEVDGATDPESKKDWACAAS